MKGLWIKVGTVALALAATQATARMYKCVDAQGGITYSQRQCPEAQTIERVQEQAPPPRRDVVPVIGSDGKRYYADPDQVNVINPQSDDYYSPANQAKRMEREREIQAQKQVNKERKAQAERNYQDALELNRKEHEEYREGRCRFYRDMARKGSGYRDYYRAKEKEFCD